MSDLVWLAILERLIAKTLAGIDLDPDEVEWLNRPHPRIWPSADMLGRTFVPRVVALSEET